MSLAYSEPELIAALKMLGFVVTPTTAEVVIRVGISSCYLCTREII
jgi:hypothetical protein